VPSKPDLYLPTWTRPQALGHRMPGSRVKCPPKSDAIFSNPKFVSGIGSTSSLLTGRKALEGAVAFAISPAYNPHRLEYHCYTVHEKLFKVLESGIYTAFRPHSSPLPDPSAQKRKKLSTVPTLPDANRPPKDQWNRPPMSRNFGSGESLTMFSSLPGSFVFRCWQRT
jgi:hypothetical protein